MRIIWVFLISFLSNLAPLPALSHFDEAVVRKIENLKVFAEAKAVYHQVFVTSIVEQDESSTDFVRQLRETLSWRDGTSLINYALDRQVHQLFWETQAKLMSWLHQQATEKDTEYLSEVFDEIMVKIFSELTVYSFSVGQNAVEALKLAGSTSNLLRIALQEYPKVQAKLERGRVLAYFEYFPALIVAFRNSSSCQNLGFVQTEMSDIEDLLFFGNAVSGLLRPNPAFATPVSAYYLPNEANRWLLQRGFNAKEERQSFLENVNNNHALRRKPSKDPWRFAIRPEQSSALTQQWIAEWLAPYQKVKSVNITVEKKKAKSLQPMKAKEEAISEKGEVENTVKASVFKNGEKESDQAQLLESSSDEASQEKGTHPPALVESTASEDEEHSIAAAAASVVKKEGSGAEVVSLEALNDEEFNLAEWLSQFQRKKSSQGQMSNETQQTNRIAVSQCSDPIILSSNKAYKVYEGGLKFSRNVSKKEDFLSFIKQIGGDWFNRGGSEYVYKLPNRSEVNPRQAFIVRKIHLPHNGGDPIGPGTLRNFLGEALRTSGLDKPGCVIHRSERNSG